MYRAIGRRKTASARVWLTPGKGLVHINGRSLEDYFCRPEDREKVLAPFALTATAQQFDLMVRVSGGGVLAQPEAIRHGVSRALVQFSEGHKPTLKEQGFLSRRTDRVLRKLVGRRKHRKKQQYSKR